jgi:hypothetical protein
VTGRNYFKTAPLLAVMTGLLLGIGAAGRQLDHDRAGAGDRDERVRLLLRRQDRHPGIRGGASE